MTDSITPNMESEASDNVSGEVLCSAYFNRYMVTKIGYTITIHYGLRMFYQI